MAALAPQVNFQFELNYTLLIIPGCKQSPLVAETISATSGCDGRIAVLALDVRQTRRTEEALLGQGLL
jgi:hypothetical protein